MAKIKLQAILAGISGKLNGSVFAKNRSGSYIRTKVTPVNPQSIAQGLVRAALTTFSKAWGSLTEAQRLAWNSAVSNFASTDIFGDIKNPSGINLFNKLNLNLNSIGVAMISNVPNKDQVGYMDALTIAADESASTLGLTFTAQGASAGQTVVVEATPPLSAGKNFAKSEFRQIGTFAGDGTSPQAFGTQYIAKFGTMPDGKKIFVRCKFISNTTGVSGQTTSASTIVVA